MNENKHTDGAVGLEGCPRVYRIKSTNDVPSGLVRLREVFPRVMVGGKSRASLGYNRAISQIRKGLASAYVVRVDGASKGTIWVLPDLRLAIEAELGAVTDMAPEQLSLRPPDTDGPDEAQSHAGNGNGHPPSADRTEDNLAAIAANTARIADLLGRLLKCWEEPKEEKEGEVEIRLLEPLPSGEVNEVGGAE